jgi:endonuclease/exonuclease/phosphatase family metal-dependent hydrolase
VAHGRKLWLSHNFEEVEYFVNKAISNRRRIQAEGFRLRQCLHELFLAKDPTTHIVVAGDFNDGPGIGFFEQFYGILNPLDALLGSSFYGTKTLYPLLGYPSDTVFTCEFDDYVDNVRCKRVLLDHVFVSNSLRKKGTAVVAHKEYQDALSNGGRDRQDRASDHRGVIVDFDLAL